MKRIITVALSALFGGGLLMSAACSGGGGSGAAAFSRADAARIVAEKTGFTGGENLTLDVTETDKNSAEIFACVSRNIFGEPTLQ